MIGWEEMGLRAGPDPVTQRWLDIRRAVARARDGVVTLARDVWEWTGTPDFDRLASQVTVGAPLILAASMLRKGASKLPQLFELVQKGDPLAARFFEMHIPAERMDELAGEFLEAMAKGSDEASRWLSRTGGQIRKNLEAVDKRNVPLEKVGEALASKQAQNVTTGELPHPNVVKRALEEALEQDGPEMAALLARKAADHGALTLLREYMSPRYWDRPAISAKRIERLKQEMPIGKWAGTLKRVLNSMGAAPDVAKYVEDKGLKVWLTGPFNHYGYYASKYGGIAADPQKAKLHLLDALESWLKEELKKRGGP